MRAGLDWMAVHSLRRGNGSCYWPSSFRLCSLVSSSVGLLSRKLHRRSNNILLPRRPLLLLYLGARGQSGAAAVAPNLLLHARHISPKTARRAGMEDREGERPKGADLMEEGYRPRKFGCFVPK